MLYTPLTSLLCELDLMTHEKWTHGLDTVFVYPERKFHFIQWNEYTVLHINEYTPLQLS